MERNSINEIEINNNEQFLINTSRKQSENPENENLIIDSNKSKEKILKLKKGRDLWVRICTIFGICFLITGGSIPLAILTKQPLLFIITGISGLGVVFGFSFSICCLGGFITIAPNEAVVYHYYGRYLGTVKENGYFFGYPFSEKKRVDLKPQEYNGNKLKVNERDGNPVELGIIVLWRIGDTFKAIFDVENYHTFVEAQSEAAIRYIGCKYPYEPIVPGEISLRSGHEIINKELKQELERRIAVSGIIIEDARVTEISYGAEIAEMMLQKQASNAAVFAKEAIVKGASNAIMYSLNEFEKNGIQFSKEDKASYITDMMNTLCMGSGISKILTN